MRLLVLFALASLIVAVSGQFKCELFCGSLIDYFQSCKENDTECHDVTFEGFLRGRTSTCQCEFIEVRYRELRPNGESIVTDESVRVCTMYCLSYERAYDQCHPDRLEKCRSQVANEFQQRRGACFCYELDKKLRAKALNL